MRTNRFTSSLLGIAMLGVSTLGGGHHPCAKCESSCRGPNTTVPIYGPGTNVGGVVIPGPQIGTETTTFFPHNDCGGFNPFMGGCDDAGLVPCSRARADFYDGRVIISPIFKSQSC